MRMYKRVVLIVCVFLVILLYGCKKEIETYESVLTVNNLPSGGVAFANVHASEKSKEDALEDDDNFRDFLAISDGWYKASPFDLIWYESISAGAKSVVVTFYSDANTVVKIISAQFSKNGDATVDWDDME